MFQQLNGTSVLSIYYAGLALITRWRTVSERILQNEIFNEISHREEGTRKQEGKKIVWS